MELRQLEHFLAVAEESHFTRAAERVRLSQSALSASIRALERDLSTELFERTTRTVRLTTAGTRLRSAARRILAEVAHAHHELAEATGLKTGELAIGVVQTLTAVDVPELLARFHRRYPGVAITLWEEPVTDLLDALRHGNLDLAYIARDNNDLPRDVTVVQKFREELAVITGDQHALSRHRSVELRELAGHVFVDFEAGRGLQTTIETLCVQAGLSRCIRFRVGQMNQLLSLVQHGLGIAIVPKPIALRSGLPVVEIDPPARRDLALVTRGSVPSNPAARAFLGISGVPVSDA